MELFGRAKKVAEYDRRLEDLVMRKPNMSPEEYEFELFLIAAALKNEPEALKIGEGVYRAIQERIEATKKRMKEKQDQ